MDVGLPIATVAPSLEGPTLAALAATNTPLTLSEVTRLGGRGSASGVRNVLLRLVETGLVHHVPGGYVLNREHLAAPSVLALAGLHAELVDRLRALASGWGDRVDLVGLFGSAARRDGGTSSDIDLLVVALGDVTDLTDELADLVQRWTGNDAQVLVLTPSRLKKLVRAREPLAEELQRDLVVVAGTPPWRRIGP